MMRIRKANVPMGFLVTFIIALIVLGAIIMFFFKDDLIDFFRNLPGHGSSEEEQDLVVNADDPKLKDLCPVDVGYVVNNKLGLCGTRSCDAYHTFNTKIYFKWEKDRLWKDGVIKVTQADANDVIGSVKGGKIEIFSKILNKEVGKDKGFFGQETGIYTEVKDDAPPNAFLMNLDDSFFLYNAICRENEVLVRDSGDKAEGVVFGFNDGKFLTKDYEFKYQNGDWYIAAVEWLNRGNRWSLMTEEISSHEKLYKTVMTEEYYSFMKSLLSNPGFEGGIKLFVDRIKQNPKTSIKVTITWIDNYKETFNYKNLNEFESLMNDIAKIK